MAIIDDGTLSGGSGLIDVVRPVGRRRVTHVLHDVDGTHSLIREWPPVMSAVLSYAMRCGLDEEFDSAEKLEALAAQLARHRTEETDRFCTESAGLSALTQMEYAIRRAVELGNIPAGARLELTGRQQRANSDICQRIWAGQERFEDLDQPAPLLAFIQERAPRLFRLYEAVLNRHCRDRNLEAARQDPAGWRVPGSLEFLAYLHQIGCRNYFVTGAVIFQGGGMFEEIAALGYRVGPGQMVEAVLGSSWDRKLPKDELFEQVMQTQGISPADVLVVGDGRSEIQAGVAMGCVTMSRLPRDAARQRELHTQFGTNYILADYTDPALKTLIRPE